MLHGPGFAHRPIQHFGCLWIAGDDFAFVDAMKLARIGPSFGGVETLIEQPAVMSYYGMTTEERTAVGIADGLVRLSVGVEEAADLIADIEQALG